MVSAVGGSTEKINTLFERLLQLDEIRNNPELIRCVQADRQRMLLTAKYMPFRGGAQASAVARSLGTLLACDCVNVSQAVARRGLSASVGARAAEKSAREWITTPILAHA